MVCCDAPLSHSYCRPEVCVWVNDKQKLFHVGVGLRQGYVLSRILFIVYMNWINKSVCRSHATAPINNVTNRNNGIAANKKYLEAMVY